MLNIMKVKEKINKNNKKIGCKLKEEEKIIIRDNTTKCSHTLNSYVNCNMDLQFSLLVLIMKC